MIWKAFIRKLSILAPSEEQRRIHLRKFADAQLPKTEAECDVQTGDPARAIAEYPTANGVDLIAIPTHVYGLFRRMLLGSVTATVSTRTGGNGYCAGRGTAPMLIKAVRSGSPGPGKLVTHRFALDEIVKAYDTFGDAAKNGALKVLLKAGTRLP